MFGLAIAVLTPPLRGADERDHFTRVYSIAHGNLFVAHEGELVGGDLPKGFSRQLEELKLDVFESDDKTAFLDHLDEPAPDGAPQFVSGGLTGTYPPGAYLPHLIAVRIGQALGLSLVALIYLARFVSVIAYAALLALAVSRMPVHRWVLVVGGLLPTAVNQAATVSADPMVTAATFVVAALALRLAVDPTANRRRLLVESGGALLLLALCKPPYLAFGLLLAIPAVRHWRSLAAPIAGITAVSGITSAVWLRYQSNNSMRLDYPGLTFLSEVPGNYAYRGLDVSGQTHDVLFRPWDFVAVIWETIAFEGWKYPTEMIGQMGSYGVAGGVLVGFVSVLVLSGFVSDGKTTFGLGVIERAGLVLTCGVTALGICVIIYTRVNEYGAPRIDQLTPRYFLSLIPLLTVALLPSPRPASTRRLALGSLVPIACTGLLSAAAIGTAGYYYR